MGGSHIDPMLLPHLFDNPDISPQPSNKNPKQKSPKNDNIPNRILNILNNQQNQQQAGSPSEGDEAKPGGGLDQIQDALQKAIEEKILDDLKTPADRSLEQFIAKERNLDPKTAKDQLETIKQEIQQQKQLEQRIKKLTDSQGRNVYDTIVNDIFSKIVQTHKLPQIYEKSPRPFSEGGQFDAQSLAGGIMSRKNGETDPLMMQQIAKREKEQKKA
ncbi:MAG: hypothetical protein LBO09_01335 [Candidatus Peribacteria bacterium]|nr:hypothetical protein [Candidatus Peribacteria bacterium]